MAQIMRPISTISDNGNISGTGSAHNQVDGTSPDTGDWWYGTNNTTNTMEVLLTDLSASVPASGTCTVTIQEAQSDDDDAPTAPTTGGAAPSFDLLVIENVTTRASVSTVTSNDGSFAAHNTLTFEASTVTDWADLRLRFVSNGSGGAPGGRRGAATSYMEISTPDASTTSIPVLFNHYAKRRRN